MNKIKGFLAKHYPPLFLGFLGSVAILKEDVVLGMLTCSLILGMVIVACSRPGVHLNVTLSKPESSLPRQAGTYGVTMCPENCCTCGASSCKECTCKECRKEKK